MSFIFMTVGLLVAAGSLKHFFPQKKKKSRRRETENQTLGTRNNLGLFLSVNAVVSSDQLAKGAVTCVFIDGLRFKIENLCPSTTILRFHFFFVVKATKNRPKKKTFPSLHSNDDRSKGNISIPSAEGQIRAAIVEIRRKHLTVIGILMRLSSFANQ